MQCRLSDDIAEWPDERIWEELQIRSALPAGRPRTAPCREELRPMRIFVTEPMRHGRLFLVGDADHIVRPTGAKGLNLAVHDVRLLAEALGERYSSGSETLRDSYSTHCVQRVRGPGISPGG